jgi:amino acid permease
VAILTEVTVEFLLRYTNSGKSETYAGMVGESFGPLGSIAVQICVIITNLGCLIIYLIIIGKLYTVHLFNSWLNNNRLWIYLVPNCCIIH